MALYAFAKFIAYCGWCWLGLRALTPAHASFAGSVSLYSRVHTPLRVVKWLIMVIAMQRERSVTSALRSPRAWLWILGGIVVSFVSDMASPEGMAGRFCVGRCLC